MIQLVRPARGHVTQFFANEIAGIKHAGQDYAYFSNGEVCDEVYAAADGVVLWEGDSRNLSWPNIMYLNIDFDRTDAADSSAGLYTILGHYDAAGNLIFLTGYGHQEATWVSAGDVVQAGQQIGVIGETGNSRGKHLHFDFVPAPFIVHIAPFYGRVDPNPYFVDAPAISYAATDVKAIGTTTEQEDDDMQTVFRDTASADPDAIYIGNFLFHRHVKSPEELADIQLMAREGKQTVYKNGEVQNLPLSRFGFDIEALTAQAVVNTPFVYREPKTGQPNGLTTIANALGSSDLQFVATRDEVKK
jgi:hypothetical protein